MKTILTLFFALICGLIHSQEKKLVWTERTCENGTEKAKKDFNQGYYFCESFGLVAETDTDFSEFYDKYLLEKYKIISTNGGCIVTDYRECYSKTMEKLVLVKYGADIFEKSLIEAKEIYYKK
jgi:hypothetical protein